MAPEPKRVRMLFALLREAHISDRKERLNLFRWIMHDPSVSSTNDLDTNEVNMIIEMLSYWKREGRLETEARQHVGDFE